MKPPGFVGRKASASFLLVLAIVAVSSPFPLFKSPAPTEEPPVRCACCEFNFNEYSISIDDLLLDDPTRNSNTFTEKQPEAEPANEQVSRGERESSVVQGIASWYGGSDGLDGALTASGEVFDASALTAAHRTLKFDTQVRVTFLKTGHSVIVRINDRGPFIPGRIIDLSRAAAEKIGLLLYGIGMVELEVLDQE